MIAILRPDVLIELFEDAAWKNPFLAHQEKITGGVVEIDPWIARCALIS